MRKLSKDEIKKIKGLLEGVKPISEEYKEYFVSGG